MLYFDKIDVSEGNGVNKASKSKECDICHYWYFLSKGFKFQTNLCNKCHDLLIISMNLSDIAILKILITAVLLVELAIGEAISLM